MRENIAPLRLDTVESRLGGLDGDRFLGNVVPVLRFGLVLGLTKVAPNTNPNPSLIPGLLHEAPPLVSFLFHICFMGITVFLSDFFLDVPCLINGGVMEVFGLI